MNQIEGREFSLSNPVQKPEISPSDAAMMNTCFSEYCSDTSSEEGVFVLQEQLGESLESTKQSKEAGKWVGRESAGGEEGNEKAEKTVKRQKESRGERDKVDLLQALLVQREAQKDTYFQESIRKERECFALKEALLRLQADIQTKECEKESLIKSQNEAEAEWKQRLEALETANSDMQQVSTLLETHAQQLTQALADAEGEKLKLMRAKTVLEAKLAVLPPLPAVHSPPASHTQACSTQYESHTEEVKIPSVPRIYPVPVSLISKLRPWCSLLLALCLLLYVLSQDLRTHLLVL